MQLPQNEWAGSGPNNVFESGRAFGLVQDGAHLPNPYADLESVPRLGNFYKLFAEVQTINQDLQQLQALKSGEPTIHNGAGPYPHLWNAGLHMPAISFTQMPQRPGTRTKFPPVPSAPVAFKKPPPMYNNVTHLSTLPHPVTRSETSRESFQTFRMIKASLLKKANQGVDGLNPLSYKTSPCKHFTLLGSCPLGNACNLYVDFSNPTVRRSSGTLAYTILTGLGNPRRLVARSRLIVGLMCKVIAEFRIVRTSIRRTCQNVTKYLGLKSAPC